MSPPYLLCSCSLYFSRTLLGASILQKVGCVNAHCAVSHPSRSPCCVQVHAILSTLSFPTHKTFLSMKVSVSSSYGEVMR